VRVLLLWPLHSVSSSHGNSISSTISSMSDAATAIDDSILTRVCTAASVNRANFTVSSWTARLQTCRNNIHHAIKWNNIAEKCWNGNGDIKRSHLTNTQSPNGANVWFIRPKAQGSERKWVKFKVSWVGSVYITLNTWQVIMETSVSRPLTALVLTTENKETK